MLYNLFPESVTMHEENAVQPIPQKCNYARGRIPQNILTGYGCLSLKEAIDILGFLCAIRRIYFYCSNKGEGLLFNKG